MNENLKIIFEVLKKINKKLTNITNFILLLPVYYIGAGLSFISWKAFHREKNLPEKSYWINSDKSKQKLEEYLKQF